MTNNERSLRAWLRGCPELSRANRFHVDYMSEEPTVYALFAQPSALKYRENVLGEIVPLPKQELFFIFTLLDAWGSDAEQNLENYAFFQKLITWIEEQNIKGNLPQVENGRTVGVYPTLSAYMAAPGADSARYQITIKIVYNYRKD